MITQATPSDLDELATIHMKVFPSSLFTLLGHDATRAMLSWYIVNSRGILLQSVDSSGHITGYCAAIYMPSSAHLGANSSVLRYSLFTFLFALLKRPWLILNPRHISRFFWAIRRIITLFNQPASRSTSSSQNIPSYPIYPYLGLVSIGVSISSRNRGLGSDLLKQLVSIAYQIEPRPSLISLSLLKSNITAYSFYTSNGFKPSHDQPYSCVMTRSL